LEDPGVGERLVLLVQCREQDAERRATFVREIEGLVRRTVAVEPRVVLIPARGLPHTSSGKLSRSRARANYLSGAYGEAPLAAAPCRSRPRRSGSPAGPASSAATCCGGSPPRAGGCAFSPGARRSARSSPNRASRRCSATSRTSARSPGCCAVPA